ncbi:carbonic anhydrase [Streptomyces sp. SCUT-3]|uniref:carbonic anhydrase n=1 Tax=Streptomyces TaxID=1883 RepID=UPI000CC39ACE|nr:MULTISPECIES: carbonic anhydrase [unclassified Streptomyces]MCZ2526811.1 carbonic anhydrase [Streptomyces sp. HB2AG]PLW71917.1 carbonic anhydrase [Streptomyces sp. DJ]QMV22742.1 carbonic anhydrase [Streptomyces sp. SCUT-3]
MQTLIDHARSFRDRAGAGRGDLSLAALADGQSPEALFITCSDSRVVPSLITGARPGELFELRTAGNAVPPYRPEHPSGEAATIEYAVVALGVSDIVVCGHSHCGAVGARVRGEDLDALPAVRNWLRASFADGLPAGDDPLVAAAVQSHVLAQLDRLRAYPCVREGLGAGSLRLHGWFYEIHTGGVLVHDADEDRFRPL